MHTGAGMSFDRAIGKKRLREKNRLHLPARVNKNPFTAAAGRFAALQTKAFQTKVLKQAVPMIVMTIHGLDSLGVIAIYRSAASHFGEKPVRR